MILEDYDTCEKSTFEPSDVESKIINFPTTTFLDWSFSDT